MAGRRGGRRSKGFADRMEPLTGLVLFRTPGGWRFAISAGGGFMDGHLADTPLSADEGEAQAALTGLVEEWSGRTVDATWRPEGRDWWVADARLVPSSR